jgi:hypothetical protein
MTTATGVRTMPERSDGADQSREANLPTFPLPEPRPEFREPAGGELNSEATYFDPDGWEEE